MPISAKPCGSRKFNPSTKRSVKLSFRYTGHAVRQHQLANGFLPMTPSIGLYNSFARSA